MRLVASCANLFFLVLPLNAQIEKKYLYYDKNKAGIIYLCSDQTQ